MVMRRVVAGRDAVEMLAVDLQALEAPRAHDAPDQRLRVLDRARRRRTEIEAVPPRDVLNRAVLVEQQQLGMIVQQVRAGIDRQRRDPQLRPQSRALDLP